MCVCVCDYRDLITSGGVPLPPVTDTKDIKAHCTLPSFGLAKHKTPSMFVWDGTHTHVRSHKHTHTQTYIHTHTNTQAYTHTDTLLVR